MTGELISAINYSDDLRIREGRAEHSATMANDAVSNGGGTASGGAKRITVVLGAQWGDEGKGKLVDLVAKDFDVVARCQVREGREQNGVSPLDI